MKLRDIPLNERSIATFMERRIQIEHRNQWECWLWKDCIDHKGYGKVKIQGSPYLAHRVGYEIFVGSIPPGFVIDHLCRTRHCVNPEHLEPVTSAENTYRGQSTAAEYRQRDHCMRGHPLAGENVYIRPDRSRGCRACDRIRNGEGRKRRRMAKKSGALSPCNSRSADFNHRPD